MALLLALALALVVWGRLDAMHERAKCETGPDRAIHEPYEPLESEVALAHLREENARLREGIQARRVLLKRLRAKYGMHPGV